MEKTRGGIGYPDFIGTSSGSSKNLLHAGYPYKIIIKPLGQLGMDEDLITYGDTLTWDFLTNLKIKWGDSTYLQFPTKMIGWNYEWEIGSKRLIVTDDLGYRAYYTGKSTVSSLGLCWDIFQSHQFQIVINGTYENDIFLIGARKVERTEETYKELEAFLPDPKGCIGNGPGIPGSTSRPLLATNGSEDYWNIGLEDPMPIYIYDGSPVLPKILLPDIGADGSDDPDNPDDDNHDYYMFIVDDEGPAERIIQDKIGTMSTFDYLMIYSLVRTIYDMTNPVLEPWMLFEIFTWLGKNRMVSENDRVFELSPWWG